MHQFPFFSLPFLFKNLPFSQMIRLREHFLPCERDLGRIIRGGQVCGKRGDGILFYFISRQENETCVHEREKKRAPIFGGSDENNSAGGGEMEN